MTADQAMGKKVDLSHKQLADGVRLLELQLDLLLPLQGERVPGLMEAAGPHCEGYHQHHYP